jgi:hypothetical protein
LNVAGIAERERMQPEGGSQVLDLPVQRAARDLPLEQIATEALAVVRSAQPSAAMTDASAAEHSGHVG